MWNLRLWLSSILLTLNGCLWGGCALFDSHVKQMDLLRGMAADVTGRLQDSSIGQIAGSAQVLNPKIKVKAAVEYTVEVGYDGLAGQAQIAAHGQLGDRVMPAEVLAIVNDATRSERERLEAILRLIRPAEPGP